MAGQWNCGNMRQQHAIMGDVHSLKSSMGLAQYGLTAPFFPDSANHKSPNSLFQPVSASGHKVLGRTQHPILYGRKQIATQKRPNGKGQKENKLIARPQFLFPFVHFPLADLADLGIL
jgi:hypothetical protein